MNNNLSDDQFMRGNTEAMPSSPLMDELPTKPIIPQTPISPEVSLQAGKTTVPNIPIVSSPMPIVETPSSQIAATQIAKTRQEEAKQLKTAISKISDLIQWLTTVLEITLGVRFVFKLIGAAPTNMFASFLYAFTNIILLPFNSIVPDPQLWTRNQFLEWSTLIGMIIYFLLFWFIRRLLRISITETSEPTN